MCCGHQLVQDAALGGCLGGGGAATVLGRQLLLQSTQAANPGSHACQFAFDQAIDIVTGRRRL
jgi:hypothetical protein